MVIEATTIRLSSESRGQLSLLVLTGDRFERHPLPHTGEVTVGRDASADIVIDDASVSRLHAKIRLALAQMITVEDQGSANGTMVGDKPLASGEVAPVEEYQMLQFGAVTAVLKRSLPVAKTRTFFPRPELEERLRDCCARASRDKLPLVVFAVRGLPSRKGSEYRRIMVEQLDAEDLTTAVEKGAAEIIVRSRSMPIADLRAALTGAGIDAELSMASYPVDGSSASELIEALSGEGLPQSDDSSPVLVNSAMKNLYRLAARIAGGKISVLILGETGTGKQLLADHIHQSSPRKDGRFVEINCSAIPSDLLESELFGHVRGAFTGASTDKIGLLAAAHGGTVFLDEIGDMSLELQAKLLRVLEDGMVRRVGEVEGKEVDVRIVAATHVDLERAAADGRFRQDLYYRLSGVTLEVPPLRERSDEIAALARTFAGTFAAQLGRPTPTLSADALAQLEAHCWPGNIRELRNVMERAVLLCSEPQIEVAHLPLDRMRSTLAVELKPRRATIERPQTTQAPSVTREDIEAALERCAGNQTRAAEALGISRRTLTKWLTRYDMPRPRK